MCCTGSVFPGWAKNCQDWCDSLKHVNLRNIWCEMLNTSSTKKKLFVATKSNLDIYSHEENGIFRYKYWSSMIALRHCFYFSITLAFCVYIDLWDRCDGLHSQLPASKCAQVVSAAGSNITFRLKIIKIHFKSGSDKHCFRNLIVCFWN